MSPSVVGNVPTDITVMSASKSDRTVDTREMLSLSPIKKQNSGTTYRDISDAVRQCNLNKDGTASLVIRWSSVQQVLAQKNSFYKDWSAEKIRNFFKYMKKLKSKNLEKE